jgi:hypothetical protein
LSLISLGYIFTYYFLLISSYSLSHFFSRQALRGVIQVADTGMALLHRTLYGSNLQ